MTRDELLVALSAMVLALPEDRPQAVAIDGMSCVGKSTLADALARIVSGAGRPVVRVSYDDFHQPQEIRHKQDRLSAQGYFADSYDAAALRRLVLDPIRDGAETVVPRSFDLADDEPVTPDPVPVQPRSVVIVEGEFLLAPQFDGSWDLGVLLVAEPEAVIDRALVRDADFGPPERVRELYVRRYLGAWALHQERNDPWNRADVVVDLSRPEEPHLLT